MEFTSIHKGLNLSGFQSEDNTSTDSINYVGDTLEKGLLAESFGYSSPIGSRVAGSEIKKGLTKVISHLEKKEKELLKETEKTLKACKQKPTTVMGTYVTKGLEAFIKNVPKCFKYAEVDAHVRQMRATNPSYSYDECPLVKYNDAAKSYVRCCVEKIYANTLMKSIEDNRTYYLSIKQATQVGVGN